MIKTSMMRDKLHSQAEPVIKAVNMMVQCSNRVDVTLTKIRM